MSKLAERLTKKKEKDVGILREFVAIYCREKHPQDAKVTFEGTRLGLPGDTTRVVELCTECERLLKHGIAKLLQCTYDPKPMCKKCQTHCYAPGYREKIRDVMKFSGLYLVKRGRLDLLAHYFI